MVARGVYIYRLRHGQQLESKLQPGFYSKEVKAERKSARGDYPGAGGDDGRVICRFRLFVLQGATCLSFKCSFFLFLKKNIFFGRCGGLP